MSAFADAVVNMLHFAEDRRSAGVSFESDDMPTSLLAIVSFDGDGYRGRYGENSGDGERRESVKECE